MSQDYDIIICGGGMVGSALAGLLAESGLRIIILESNASPKSSHANKDMRVSALSLATKNILHSIGAWQTIAAAEKLPTPIMEMKIWDAGSNGQLHFDSAEIGEACLGYIVENEAVLIALRAKISQSKNIQLKFNARLQDINFSNNEVTVITEDGQTMSAKLLIGADGANSRVRTIIGIANHSWQYSQTAIVSTIDSEKPHMNTAWQRFLPTGPLAFLPLPSPQQTSIVWSVDIDRVDELLQLNDQEFAEKLGEQFEHRLGKIKKVSQRYSFPLTFGHAKSYADERLALVGAHRLHPLAGQGANMGLLDVAALAETILKSHESGKDFGQARALNAYTRWRKQDNQIMLMALDSLKRVFSIDQPLLNTLRGLGMNLVKDLPPVRHQMMRFASGLGGNLPKAARTTSTASRL